MREADRGDDGSSEWRSDVRAGRFLLVISAIIAWWWSPFAGAPVSLYAATRFKRAAMRQGSVAPWVWTAILMTIALLFAGGLLLYRDAFPPPLLPSAK